jgi:hypothetical protein
MKTAERTTPNRWTTLPGNRAHGVEDQNQFLLKQTGCEARKIPAGGDVFLLDFSFYRTNRELQICRGRKLM